MKHFLLLLYLTLPLAGQDKVADHIRTNRGAILREFADFLKLENVAHNTPKGHADIQRNADYLVKMLEQRGLKPQILNVEGGFPAVYGEWLTPGATKTIVFYAHYDGQPVVPSQWKTPPFSPALIGLTLGDPRKADTPNDDLRLYARGASDDKAGVYGLITAIDALKATGTKPSVNIKLFFEGEEEMGSEHLGAILAKYADLLKSDLWVLCDGPVHQSGRLQLVYGARGSMGLEMTVYGPNRALHSGHYGNWSPNPAVDLANIIARLRDDRGRMATEAFAQSAVPPSQAEWQAIQQFPNVESSLKKELGLSRSLTDMRGQGQRVESSVLYPAMNIRGIRAGNVGDQATNSVMTEASASIDFRLVPNQTPENVREQFESWLKATGHTVITDDRPMTDELRATNPPVVRLRWQPGYPPMRTSFDNAAAQAMVRTIEAAFPKQTPLLRLPTLGGSVPMYLFQQQFKVPAMILPIANYDNNQHAANENIRLGNLWQGIELYAALMAELGKQWK